MKMISADAITKTSSEKLMINIQWNMQWNVIETISNLGKPAPTKMDDWKQITVKQSWTY